MTARFARDLDGTADIGDAITSNEYDLIGEETAGFCLE
jgi:hypothetical protein